MLIVLLSIAVIVLLFIIYFCKSTKINRKWKCTEKGCEKDMDNEGDYATQSQCLEKCMEYVG